MSALDELTAASAAYQALYQAATADPYGFVRMAYEDYCAVVAAPPSFLDWLAALTERAGMPHAARPQQTRPHLRYL